MIDYARALGLVYDTIDVVNRQLPAARRLRKAPDTVIAGAGGALDSLGFVNFVLALEEKVAAVAGAPVALLDEDMLVEQSPLRTVESVSRYIAARVA